MGSFQGGLVGGLLGGAWGVSDGHLSAACRLLGLDPSIVYHPEQVRETFKTLVKANHPDNGGDGKMDMAALKAARDLLVKHSLEKPSGIIATVCGTCKGAGSVRAASSFQTITCPSCHGTGDKS